MSGETEPGEVPKTQSQDETYRRQLEGNEGQGKNDQEFLVTSCRREPMGKSVFEHIVAGHFPESRTVVDNDSEAFWGH